LGEHDPMSISEFLDERFSTIRVAFNFSSHYPHLLEREELIKRALVVDNQGHVFFYRVRKSFLSPGRKGQCCLLHDSLRQVLAVDH
jgi:hypothetical protein